MEIFWIAYVEEVFGQNWKLVKWSF